MQHHKELLHFNSLLTTQIHNNLIQKKQGWRALFFLCNRDSYGTSCLRMTKMWMSFSPLAQNDTIRNDTIYRCKTQNDCAFFKTAISP